MFPQAADAAAVHWRSPDGPLWQGYSVLKTWKFNSSLLKSGKCSHDLDLALFCFPSQAFGGYLTFKMLAATDKLFQCTAAVAPITDFRLYSELQPCHQLFIEWGTGNCCGTAKQFMCWCKSRSTAFRCCILREISRPSSEGGARVLGEARDRSSSALCSPGNRFIKWMRAAWWCGG